MSKLFERLVVARGLDEAFLSPKYEECLDPYLLPQMCEAVERIKFAVKNHEKCLIYGDYDVDGVTASTVLYDALRLAGIDDIEIMLPNRFVDGYGMSIKVVQRAISDGVKLVLTVDCGSRNHDIVAELRKNGVDVVVTDHHECEETLPDALAVVNPKRKDAEKYVKMVLEGSDPTSKEFMIKKAVGELRELAGAGVAFKIAQALMQEGLIPEGQEKWLLDLATIGTICDSMILQGENRRICKYGMLVLEKTRRPGLKELMMRAGVKKLSSDAIGYQIGPRLNAAGRMDTAEKALNLLMSKRRAEAALLATELENLNDQRKHQQNSAVKEIAARGVGEGAVVWKHAFRNALIPIITQVIGWFTGIFSGSVVIENIFGLNGMGRMYIQSLNNKDFEVVLLLQMFYVIVGLVGNLVVDLAYGLADPRVRVNK